jgi:hypothetical protein
MYRPRSARGRLSWEGVCVKERLDGRDRKCRPTGKEICVAGARVGEVQVPFGIDDDVATEAPQPALMLQHRQQQQMLKRGHEQIRSVHRVDGLRHEGA